MTALALILSLTGALVVDGDTLKLDGQRYRLWGIDAPEQDEPGGPEPCGQSSKGRRWTAMFWTWTAMTDQS